MGGGDINKIEALYGVKYKVPLIPLKPDINYIVQQMEHVINNFDYYLSLSSNGRRLIAEQHDPKLIAAQYVEAWLSY